MKRTKRSIAAKLVPIGKQVFASMAIGLALFVCLEAVVQFSFGLETADRFFIPMTVYLLALLVFPLVQRFLDTGR